MHPEISKESERRRTFALIIRGFPEDFAGLVEQAKIYGFYIVYTKSSQMRLIVEEVSW